mgnify:FL=1
MKKNILIGLSGGPSTAINASMAGVIRAASASSRFNTVYGALHGIAGVLSRDIIDLSPYSSEEKLRLLIQTPAMALGSCRKKLTAADWPAIEQVFQDYDIGVFFYIGGNDSMDTVLQLDRYFKENGSGVQVIGVPKTIDNDLPVTDHTPGFGSSAKYLYHTMHEIIRDSEIYPIKNVVVVEIMGRNSGWLTLAAGLEHFMGGVYPQIVAIPEIPFDEFGFLNQVKELLKTEHTVICAVSEGIRNHNGDYVGMETKSGAVDTFGHTYLSGVGKYLELQIAEKIGCKVRSIELNVMQRCSAHLASKTDLDEAVQIGEAAVSAAEAGATGIMMVFERTSNHPYAVRIAQTDVSNVANLAKDVPECWHDLSDQSVRDEIKQYLLPLMQGELEPIRDKTGLPVFLDIRGIHSTRE